jgi:hypothetical protein
MSMSVAASVSGSNLRPRSCGDMGSNSGGRRGDSVGPPAGEVPSPALSAAQFFLDISFATPKPLNGLALAKPSKVSKPKMSLT